MLDEADLNPEEMVFWGGLLPAPIKTNPINSKADHFTIFYSNNRPGVVGAVLLNTFVIH